MGDKTEDHGGKGTVSTFRPKAKALGDKMPINGAKEWPLEYRRDDLETQVFGYKPETKGRPVYGALNIDNKKLAEEDYGLFVLVMKYASVKDFCTVTTGDSLQNFVQTAPNKALTDVRTEMGKQMGSLADGSATMDKI